LTQQLIRVAGLFVGQHDPPDVVGDPALAATQGFTAGLALGELAVDHGQPSIQSADLGD
jgi:hypothetical protein